LLPTTYKVLSNILLSRLTQFLYEIIEDNKYGCRSNRFTIDQIFCIHKIVQKKWECRGTVYQLFINFENAYDPVRTEES